MTGELLIGELFAGYGGLGMGIQQAYGGRVAWVSEIDSGACQILAHRMPDVPNIGDVTTVDWATVPAVDVLSGGSPCQDLSKSGRRAGMTHGTRSNLWVAMREAIAALRPPLVVWENVHGAFTAPADSALEPCPGCLGDRRDEPALRALGRVLGDLSDLGYDASWTLVRAADVGAPHARLRVFVAAHPNGEPFRHDVRGVDPAEGNERPRGIADDSHARSGDRRAPDGPADPRLDEWRPVDVRRWERVTGEPVPRVTDDLPRISEWCMGLPAGYVTDVPGISASAALHALGNGVVPQQAAYALRSMASWEDVA